MAILRGFPPSNTISPSVRITEKDLSFIAPQQSFHRAGLVGFASKGPINVPTVVATQRQLNTIFGYPHPESGDPYLIYAAEQYLLIANELYIVRVADEENVSDERAEVASVDVPSAGGRIVIMSEQQGNYIFTKDSFFRWKLNGVLHSNALVVLAGTYSAAQLAEELNLQVNPEIDGIQFITDSGDDYIGIQTTWAFGPDSELEFIAVQDAMYGGAVLDGNVTGLGLGMTQATLTGTQDRYPVPYGTAGDYDLAGLTDMNIQIVVDGTDNVLIDNTVQIIDLLALEGSSSTIAQVVTEINSQIVDNGGTLPGGWEAFADGDNLGFRTTHHGRDARLLIKPDSTAAGLFGLTHLTKQGTSPISSTGDGSENIAGRINGNSNISGAVSMSVFADSAGIDGNSTQLVVENNIRECLR